MSTPCHPPLSPASKRRKINLSVLGYRIRALLGFYRTAISTAPASVTSPASDGFSRASQGLTYGMYMILCSSSSVVLTSSGSWPDTLMAYMPGA